MHIEFQIGRPHLHGMYTWTWHPRRPTHAWRHQKCWLIETGFGRINVSSVQNVSSCVVSRLVSCWKYLEHYETEVQHRIIFLRQTAKWIDRYAPENCRWVCVEASDSRRGGWCSRPFRIVSPAPGCWCPPAGSPAAAAGTQTPPPVSADRLHRTGVLPEPVAPPWGHQGDNSLGASVCLTCLSDIRCSHFTFSLCLAKIWFEVV